MVIAAPALVETYAVLTRLPSPHRLTTSAALALLEANFIDAAEVVALDGKSYRTLLHEAPQEDIAGGRTYDAVIAACAARANVATLLTFNARHFMGASVQGIRVCIP